MTTRARIARRPGAVVRTAARRLTAWDDTLFNSVLTDENQQSLELMKAVADAEKRGCTLIRMLVHMQYHASVPGAVSGVTLVTFGVSVVSDDAFAAFIVPDPQQEGDFPVLGWVFRDRTAVVDETLATGIVAPVSMRYDLRSQRKLDRSTLIWTSIAQGREGTAFTVQETGIIRCLYKLP